MKPKLISLLFLSVALFCLTGCECKHVWSDATCATPKTCSQCNITEGSTLDHVWLDATCTTPVTCENCKQTAGNELGHEWQKATCTKSKICSRCQTEEGVSLGHQWKKATCTKPKTCKVCKKTKGKKLGHNWKAATTSNPKTCKRCKKQTGNVLKQNTSNPENSEENNSSTAEDNIRKCRVCSSEAYSSGSVQYYYCYGHKCNAPSCSQQKQSGQNYCPIHIREYNPAY